MGLKEGKNREIRKVMEHLGWSVSRLIRIAYGPFQLGLLPEGDVEEVPTKALKEQLGSKGAEADRKPGDYKRASKAAAPADSGKKNAPRRRPV